MRGCYTKDAGVEQSGTAVNDMRTLYVARRKQLSSLARRAVFPNHERHSKDILMAGGTLLTPP
jgi:hypothetical protein